MADQLKNEEPLKSFKTPNCTNCWAPLLHILCKPRFRDDSKQLQEFIGFGKFVHRVPADYPPYIMTPITVMGTIVSMSLWRMAYYFMTKRGIKEDIAHRSLAIVKGIVSVVTASLVGNLNEKVFDGHLNNTWTQTVMLILLNGQFIHDMFYFALNSADDIINIAHHIITVISFSYSMILGQFAGVIMFFNWAYESSSIPLHLRYMMRKWNMTRSHPNLYTLIEVTFILMYTIQRFVFGMHYAYYILTISGEEIPFIPKILCLSINVTSVAFYKNVFRLFLRRYGDEFEFLKHFFPPV